MHFNKFIGGKLPSYSAEVQEGNTQIEKEGCLTLTPWIASTIVLEVIKQHFLLNPPEKLGYAFEMRYDKDSVKSTVPVEIAYDWKSRIANKYPAVFVGREDSYLDPFKTFNSVIGRNTPESKTTRATQVALPIVVNVVSKGVAATEMLAEYVSIPLIEFAPIIRDEYCFAQFKLRAISKPQIVIAGEDYFHVTLTIETLYNYGWTLAGDHLKIKTIQLKPSEIFKNIEIS